MLGGEPPPDLDLNKKRSRTSVRISRRDSHSVKIKLSIGGTAEKIVSAIHNVLSEHSDEESNLDRCKFTVRYVGKLEKDVQRACNHDGDPRRELMKSKIENKLWANKLMIKIKLRTWKERSIIFL